MQLAPFDIAQRFSIESGNQLYSIKHKTFKKIFYCARIKSDLEAGRKHGILAIGGHIKKMYSKSSPGNVNLKNRSRVKFLNCRVEELVFMRKKSSLRSQLTTSPWTWTPVCTCEVLMSMLGIILDCFRPYVSIYLPMRHACRCANVFALWMHYMHACGRGSQSILTNAFFTVSCNVFMKEDRVS